MKRVRVIYSGSVQGVGFRFAVVSEARRHGVSGWVRNTADGKVELTAEGEAAVLMDFLTAIDSSMSGYIRDKKISWEPFAGNFTGFKIEY